MSTQQSEKNTLTHVHREKNNNVSKRARITGEKEDFI